MSDGQPTIWQAEQHTRAKHRILIEYLKRWMPILSQQSRNVGTPRPIKYIDCFAGPGIYTDGTKGSPLLALDAALGHAREFPVPVQFIFIENDRERWQVLADQLSQYNEVTAQSQKVHLTAPIRDDCRITLARMLEESDRRHEKFGPALIFLDQFGYSAVPMLLIQQLMSQPQCEVLTYLFWRDLDRFITDHNKHAGITEAFGHDGWKPAIQMASGERERFMLDTYTAALRQHAGSAYVWPFAMLDENQRLLYWLFFCTNNIRGLEEMKKAMWKVDQTGAFRFSDRDGLAQLTFLTTYTDKMLAHDMASRLAGRTMTVGQVFEWVLTETPAYKFKVPLAALEKRGSVKPVSPPRGRRPGTFPDDNMLLRFEVGMFGT